MGAQNRHLVADSWEAVFAADYTIETISSRTRLLAASLQARNLSCLVAHDTRFLASQIARYVFGLLEGLGLRVSLCSTPVPLPSVYHALDTRRADSAIVVTAGNQPYYMGGLLLIAPPENSSVPASSTLPVVDLPPFPVPPAEPREQTQVDLRAPYVELLRSRVEIEPLRRTTLTLFVDAMNGSCAGLIPQIIGEGAQAKAIEINREPDPLFNRQTPLPIEAGMARLRKLVRESDSHLGVGLSADGTALGVVDGSGDMLSSVEIGLLLAQHLARQYRQRGQVVLPLGSGTLGPWEDAQNLKVEQVAEPLARASELLFADRGGLLVGMTASGQPCFGRGPAAPDAILAALLMIDLAARNGGNLRTLVEELRRSLVRTSLA